MTKEEILQDALDVAMAELATVRAELDRTNIRSDAMKDLDTLGNGQILGFFKFKGNVAKFGAKLNDPDNMLVIKPMFTHLGEILTRQVMDQEAKG